MASTAPDHNTIARFRRNRVSKAIEGLFYQLVHWLHNCQEINFEHLFVDGTKLEANANRYSFTWRKTIERNLGKLRDKLARKSKSGYKSLVSVYKCISCDGCEVKASCTKASSDKQLEASRKLHRQRETSLTNIKSDKGIQLRINRLIQAEGAFGVLKEDYRFRRFLTRGEPNVRTEMLFLALAYNLNKPTLRLD